MLIELERIKQHLNLDMEYTEYDEYLVYLEGVAEELVQKHIDRSFDTFEGGVPKPLLQAMLLMIGNFFDNRESVAYSNALEIPTSLTYILSLYRDYENTTI